MNFVRLCANDIQKSCRASTMNTLLKKLKRLLLIQSMRYRSLKQAVAVLSLALLSACMSFSSSGPVMYAGDQWAILPLTNLSGVASGAYSAQSMVESNLRARGVVNVNNLPVNAEVQSNTESMLSIAREAGARYAVSGTVNQWGRGKRNGRDARADIELVVHDVTSGAELWRENSVVANRVSGSVAAVANKSVNKLVNSMNLVQGLSESTVSVQKLESVALTSDMLGSGDSSQGESNLLVQPSLGFRTVGFTDDGFTDKIKRDLVGKSIAIFYGATPPVDELSLFDRIVLEPDNIKTDELTKLTQHGAASYAYLSVGEVGPHRSYKNTVRDEWILGENEIWDSKVLDLSNPGWTSFLMKRIDALMAAGYAGLFLDTMDSYHIYAKTPELRAAQESALGAFIQRVTQRHPGIRLIANRGFEVLDTTGPYLEAIAAESLYASWDNAAQQYVDVKESDRSWLMGKLNNAKSQYGLDVIAIEYLPPERRDEARQVATVIADKGFVPWVSTPELDYVGVGAMEVIPRKVMMLFDSTVNGVQSASEVHALVAPILEYYGYVPVYFDVARDALPLGELKGQYAGIVSWTASQYQVPGLSDWFKKQLSSDIPFAMFGTPMVSIDNQLAKKLGIRVGKNMDMDSVKATYKSKMMDYEKPMAVRVSNLGLPISNNSKNNEVHFSVTDKNGSAADLVVTGSWGGFAMHPVAANVDFDDSYSWVTDPFTFLEKTLRLQRLPMPDVTTENGKRLWAAHIDGDALPSWAEVPGRKLGAEMIHETILQRYNMPHSISIVEGEMVGVEAYADRRERMFDVAKRIFAMPSVEIATHTYSHPYKWGSVGLARTSGKYNLDVGNYQFSPEREIGGSAQFINTQLAPPNKKTELMLWSGDALPLESALAAAHNNGLTNLNGGYTVISKARPSVSLISPMARTVGPYVQAYAPIMNENVYTNEWLGPFDGFRRVIETLEMTDKPRRFKPASIYYHFYAGTKVSALRSLDEIYSWSVAQDINPVYASYYAKKVPEFRSVGVSRYLDGSWKLNGLSEIKSIRILDKNIWPNIRSSRGLAGARQLHDGVYVHTDGLSKQVIFNTIDKRPNMLHLVSANGKVTNWSQSENGFKFRITAHVPVELELSQAAAACVVRSNGKVVQGQRTKDSTILFSFTTRDTGDAILNCQA